MHSVDSLSGLLRIVGIVVMVVVLNRRRDSSGIETSRRSEHRVDTQAITRAVTERRTRTRSRGVEIQVPPASPRSDPMWDRELDG
jgi:hypothetical protein